jgi:prepilin-type N-terminal cleavage/methylation domain-containing protein
VSIRRLAARLTRLTREDSGMGLIEVIVALTIFAVIAVGMAYSMTAMQRLTDESTHRETASNLAAAEIDRIQSQPDAFDVYSNDLGHPGVGQTVLVDGINYNVLSKVEWVTTTGSTGSCGTGGGNLQYKRVNVTVSWPGMYLQNPVRADSALAPDARINNPSYGTILVSVQGEDGKGRTGVTVRVTPVSGSGGQTITDTIDPTDSDGCSYILNVVPGVYRVEVEKAGYVDKTDAVTAIPFYPSVQVSAGSTATSAFTYENGMSFAMQWGANYATTPGIPSNLDTTYIGGLRNVLKPTPVTPVKLYPMSNGYQAIAGDSATCLNVDPGLWTANATLKAGVRADPVLTSPGGSGTLNVPMGIIKVPIPNNTNQYVTAVQQVMVAGSGNPGCAAGKTYTFSTQFTKNTTQTLALPYGNWIVWVGNNVGVKTTAVTGITVVGGVVVPLAGTPGALTTGLSGGGTVSGTTVSLDPRSP